MWNRFKLVVDQVLGPRVLEESDLIHGLFRRRAGVLAEVGAHTGDPAMMRFADEGWTIHAFEPDSDNRRLLEAKAANRPNIILVPKAVSDESGTMTLYKSAESTGISSLVAFTPGHEAAAQVEVTTLREHLDATSLATVDFLKIDVEGHERAVLAGFPWETHHPRAVLLEFEDRKTNQLGYSWRDLADELVGHGYRVIVSEWYPVRRYGGAHRWRRFATYPTALRDSDACGNLIAVDPVDFCRLRIRGSFMALRYRARRQIERLRGR